MSAEDRMEMSVAADPERQYGDYLRLTRVFVLTSPCAFTVYGPPLRIRGLSGRVDIDGEQRRPGGGRRGCKRSLKCQWKPHDHVSGNAQ